MARGSSPGRDKPHYHGHRDRLRDRFRQTGGDALADYELLELLLFHAVPRGDMKPVAKALLERFGSIAGVMAASSGELATVDGVGERAALLLHVVRESTLRMARQEVLERPVIGGWDKLLDYLRLRLGHEKVEQFRLLFLDRKNRLIAEELQQKGTVDHTPVYPREVIKRALDLSASAIIMVHNHPSGDPTPSKADIEMTREVVAAGRALGLAVHDHVVIGQNGHYSFRAHGLI